MTTLVIDGDLLAYRCAAANEERYVTATNKDTLEQIEFPTATKFKEWAGSKADNYSLEPGQRPMPEAFAFKSIRDMIDDMTAKVGATSYHVVISGKGNFRLDIPLPFRYKCSREGTTKPLALDACKQYLIHRHNAEVSEGCEADDLIAGYSWQGRKDKSIVVATIDKDQMGCEGWVFDWTKMTEPFLVQGFGELRIVERPNGKTKKDGTPSVDKSVKGHGKIWMLFQCLYGDTADDYKPCDLAKTKFGELAAYELLKDCKTQEEAFKVVLDRYKFWYSSQGSKYPNPLTYRAWDGSMHTKDYVEIFQLYADCAYMRRWPEDRFDVRKVMEKYAVI